MSNIASNTVSVLGGAALGAIAAYLLDPDHGVDRRHQILSTANDAVSNASDAVRSTAQTAAGSASGLAANISHYAQQLADHVSSQAASAGDQARGAADQAQSQLNSSIQSLISRAKDYTDDFKSRAQSRANDFSDRAKSSVSRRTGWQPASQGPSAVGISTGVVGAVALGAGIMFFADPVRGRSRRAWVSDKINSWVIRGRKSATRYGHHLSNQVKGAVAEAKNSVPEQWSNAVEQATNSVSSAVQQATDAATSKTE